MARDLYQPHDVACPYCRAKEGEPCYIYGDPAKPAAKGFYHWARRDLAQEMNQER